MLRNEIGSEFWTAEETADRWMDLVFDNADSRTFLSGRTALSAIIDDIMAVRNCKSAYLPSYCCESMIEPFIRRDIQVSFYPVVFQDGVFYQRADESFDADIVLFLEYFGFRSAVPRFSHRSVLICDVTHSLFLPKREADYTFASFRKWGAVAGAAFAQKNGNWNIGEYSQMNKAFLNCRYDGYHLKRQYMNGTLDDKACFLEPFSKAEAILDNDYEKYAADPESLKTVCTLYSNKEQRRENASFLLEELNKLEYVEPLFGIMKNEDVPLFIPVYLKNGKRDQVKKALIDERIYCPNHWPVSALHKLTPAEKELYDGELSLVCDQRYTVKDMERELSVLKANA